MVVDVAIGEMVRLVTLSSLIFGVRCCTTFVSELDSVLTAAGLHFASKVLILIVS